MPIVQLQEMHCFFQNYWCSNISIFYPNALLKRGKKINLKLLSGIAHGKLYTKVNSDLFLQMDIGVHTACQKNVWKSKKNKL